MGFRGLPPAQSSGQLVLYRGVGRSLDFVFRYRIFDKINILENTLTPAAILIWIAAGIIVRPA